METQCRSKREMTTETARARDDVSVKSCTLTKLIDIDRSNMAKCTCSRSEIENELPQAKRV